MTDIEGLYILLGLVTFCLVLFGLAYWWLVKQ